MRHRHLRTLAAVDGIPSTLTTSRRAAHAVVALEPGQHVDLALRDLRRLLGESGLSIALKRVEMIPPRRARFKKVIADRRRRRAQSNRLRRLARRDARVFKEFDEEALKTRHARVSAVA